MKRGLIFKYFIFYCMAIFVSFISNSCNQNIIMKSSYKFYCKSDSSLFWEINNIGNDSLVIESNMFVGFKSIYTYVKGSNGFYECIYENDFSGENIGIERVLVFTQKDTITNYIFNIEKYPPVKVYKSDDFVCEINRIGLNKRVTKKVYTEINQSIEYFYNDAYRIDKLIVRLNNKRLVFYSK